MKILLQNDPRGVWKAIINMRYFYSMSSNATEARLVSAWLETRKTEWVRISAHWKNMADARLASDLRKKLDMPLEEAQAYVQKIVSTYQSKGWIR